IWKEYACNVSFLMKPGTIKELRGIEEILNIPGVIDAVPTRGEGETLPEEAKGMLRQITLRVFATAKYKKELENLLNQIYDKLEIIGDNGENLLLEGLDTKELEGALL